MTHRPKMAAPGAPWRWQSSPDHFSVEHACSLLSYTDMTVSEVSDDTGFFSIHSFSRAFGQAMGMSPRAYRGSG
ncbi:MAG: helix-turn-helix domain-containing protein [Lentisphaerae bacterium]|nr:helix-turn-helix domain-containing protein [Lentisphaerota bacterium]MBT5609716.1 helix-turn-helix domain-containing protein [Lentisphaerota bacterium]MBT7061452.1 helix-turn-helix domain-containing protein [Lentisphaerota bacterium]MBT7844200.1 helix-turn-helix domain-containing protein [Lentisphaerota bacterium]